MGIGRRGKGGRGVCVGGSGGKKRRRDVGGGRRVEGEKDGEIGGILHRIDFGYLLWVRERR